MTDSNMCIYGVLRWSEIVQEARRRSSSRLDDDVDLQALLPPVKDPLLSNDWVDEAPDTSGEE